MKTQTPRPDSDLTLGLRWAQKSVFNLSPQESSQPLLGGSTFNFCFPGKDGPSFSNSKAHCALSVLRSPGQTSCCQCKWMASPGCSHHAQWVIPIFEMRVRFYVGSLWELTDLTWNSESLNYRGFGRSSSTASLPLSSSIHSFICWAFID